MQKTSTIIFSGDIGLTFHCGEAENLFSMDVLRCINSADALCINLELPFVENTFRMAPYTHPSLISSTEFAPLLQKLNPAVVNIGTNHCMDGGKEGIKLTRSILEEIGACSIGAGSNENEARKPCFITIRETRFGFLSFCKKGNFTASREKPGAALLSEANLKIDIPEARKRCDFLIVSMHIGMEFSKSVHPVYRDLTHLAVDLGASCVIGHHPHVIQGIETYQGIPIFYSLGNFLFDNYAGAVSYKGYWEDRHKGILAKVFFSSSEISYEVIPVMYTSRPLAVRIAQEADAEAIISEVISLSAIISAGIDEISAEVDAVEAIAKREIATIIVLTRIHGLRFLWHFVKDLKLRHFRMMFRAVCRRMTSK